MTNLPTIITFHRHARGYASGGMSYDHRFSVGRLGLYSKWLEYPCRFKSTSQRQIFIVI
ncbi:predicted protein [Plenodomus lingam JN3]|uniref:Predicted protein n=1 Tax=Leptosphaeria maculans (strain JN3 / isolate v23.1.3 / race Av1-4-5-6-7-8) TaxID=985895 RepID=E5ABL6_LEPMJ|nr:predicted protein [Plenodomus lingam JN3]CBY01057.1 predicted protein [Plenodomus lingam JN3]